MQTHANMSYNRTPSEQNHTHLACKHKAKHDKCTRVNNPLTSKHLSLYTCTWHTGHAAHTTQLSTIKPKQQKNRYGYVYD